MKNINTIKTDDVDPRLRKVVGEDRWKRMQKDHKQLDENHYVCRCDTCHKVFFDKPLRAVQEMLRKGTWHFDLPQRWYVEAARHWIPHKFHSIRVVISGGGSDESLVKDDHGNIKGDLSATWTMLAKDFAKQNAKISLDDAMTRELDDIERHAKY